MFASQAAIVAPLTPAIGEVFLYAGTSVPDKCLECLGQEVSKTTYAALYSAIGDLWATTGGAASPSASNFRLPPSVISSSNIYPAGKGSGDTVGGYIAGSVKGHTHVGTSSSDGNHRHQLSMTTVTVGTSGSITSFVTGSNYGGNSAGGGAHTHSVTVSSQGTVSRPETAVVKLCIYTGV